jgi:predicted acylesterase/phospholipase RssA
MPEQTTDKTRHPGELPLCDIVMEGGVTSGIIYPTAVVELSREFRLKNIGGTSVGALAAALAAAAEAGRARDPLNHSGFDRLGDIPGQLQAPGFSGRGATRLFDLFQPHATTRPLFGILASALNRPSKKRMLGHILLAAVRHYPAHFWSVFLLIAGIQVLAGTGGGLPLLFALAFGAVCAFGAVAYAAWRTLTGPLVENGYGLCTGYLDDPAHQPAPGDVHEPLTLWLSRLINAYAGAPADGAPLTFGDLWRPTDGPGTGPPDWLPQAEVKDWRYIDLQMITTNLAHGRPYRFPYDDDDQQLFFRPSELKRWFPPNVIEHMEAHSRDYAALRTQSQPKSLPAGMLMLPAAADLPVVFAARLSLSFPFLLSALPLYALDYEPQDYAKRDFKRCWFSDGGICSDFPIHFFDSPMPLWPTFGIKLEDERFHYPVDAPEKGANRFFFPNSNERGRGDTFARFDDAETGSKQLWGCAGAMLDAARKWRDHMLVRSPAVRDRVVRVYLKKTEGGLNLNMPKEIQENLSGAGATAAAMLASRFRPASADPMNFDNHRWMRVRKLTRVLEKDMSSIDQAMAAAPPGTAPWNATFSAGPPGGHAHGNKHAPSAAQLAKIGELMDRLRDLSIAAGGQPDLLRAGAPRRESVIRIVPDI